MNVRSLGVTNLVFPGPLPCNQGSKGCGYLFSIPLLTLPTFPKTKPLWTTSPQHPRAGLGEQMHGTQTECTKISFQEEIAGSPSHYPQKEFQIQEQQEKRGETSPCLQSNTCQHFTESGMCQHFQSKLCFLQMKEIKKID